jgi:hypothetical protein
MHYMHTQLNKIWMNCAIAGTFSVVYGLNPFLLSRDGFSI